MRASENQSNSSESGGTPIRVFVYGTLKPGGFYWDRFCEGKVTDAIEAKVRGKLYDLPVGYPALTQSDQDITNWSHGYILILKNQSVLDGLDHLEGYNPNRSESENEYQRIATEAFTIQAEALGEVWTYIMSPEKVFSMNGIFIPDGKWPLK